MSSKTILITVAVRCPSRAEVEAWLTKRGFESTPAAFAEAEGFYEDADGRGLFLFGPHSNRRVDRAMSQFIEDAAEVLEISEELIAFEMGLITTMHGAPS